MHKVTKNNVLAARVELLQVSEVAVDKTLHVSAVAVENKRSSGSNKIGFILNKRIVTQYKLYAIFHIVRIINNDPAYQK